MAAEAAILYILLFLTFFCSYQFLDLPNNWPSRAGQASRPGRLASPAGWLARGPASRPYMDDVPLEGPKTKMVKQLTENC